MRIISGIHKGRKITAPKTLPVRPTTDMAKEALFNILNNTFYFDEIKVLDLYSGTGNISYEFASRGCENIFAVDKNFGCIKFINSITDTLELPINTIKSDVISYLENSILKYDVIFADPPYNFTQNQFETIPELVYKNNLLEEDGILIIEHSPQTKLEHLSHFNFSKKYGSSMFSFFKD